MSWELFLSILAILFSLLAVYLGYLFNKRIEDYRQTQIQRHKAELAAKLFAKWIKYRGNETKVLSNKERVEYYEELTTLSFELSLWLKDDELLREIMMRLQNEDNSKPVWDIIAMVRNYILDIDSSLEANKVITFWPTDKESKKLFDKSKWK